MTELGVNILKNTGIFIYFSSRFEIILLEDRTF